MTSFTLSILPQTYSTHRIDTDVGRLYDCGVGKYPSITTVLGCRNTEWLAEWVERVGEDVAASRSKKAASIGTSVHLLSEMYLLNTPESTMRRELTRVNPEAALRFKNFKPFLDEIEEVYFLERPVFSTSLQVAGTVDCFAKFRGRSCVIDFKTSSWLKKPEDIPGYFAQASFYAIAISELYDVPIPDIVIAIACEKQKEPIIYESKVRDHVGYLVETIRMYRNGERD